MKTRPIPVSGAFVTRQIRDMWNDRDLAGLCRHFPDMRLSEVKAIGIYEAHIKGDSESGFQIVEGRE